MGRKFDPHQTLIEKVTWDVARNCTDIALEFALLGYIDIATSLFNITADFNSTCRASWSPGLYFAWEATNSWPAAIPAEERTLKYLAKLENERLLWKRDTHKEEGGLEKLLETAQGYAKAAVWGSATLRPDDYAAALDLAIFQGRKDKAQEIVKTIADNFHMMYRELSKSRLAWSMLKDKVVAQELGLDDGKVRAFGEEVLKTFQKRIKDGPLRRPYENKSMRELVQLCNDNTLKNAIWEETDYDPDNPPTTIIREPASAEEVTALERRLGCKSGLPDDFKEFLLVSNGLDQWWNGFFGEPELSGTDAVRIYDAQGHQQEWDEEGIDLTNIPGLPFKTVWPKFDHTVLINAGDAETVLVWMIEPEVIEVARKLLWETYEESDEETKKQFMECLNAAYGSKEGSDELTWLIISWCPQAAKMQTFSCFREFLEYLAGETAREDTMDEEDAQGRPLYSHDVFAYGLR
ncbi:uncharacterized protein BDZ99DRAFT_457733 [Mytilinidion resinicola]|uniref:Knr4/Smi1-like domain-containing protein n=1 Tax=Mytilinidion resinicola TaxID=574789 RepID=A0A6A6Z4W2_9PEZI|nr:uncharacterized protein BDZ99DRAFT_457733 [Mytilinidion resinicola]KAF2815779.1 hypothetical protein BDZ99DRAFT_457733 [Mytilinidion resinicola]